LEHVKLFSLMKMLRPSTKRVPLSFLWFAYKKIRNERPHWFDDKVRINSGIPPFPSKSFDRFADILLNQKRIPHTINFAITSKCLYKCPHCLYGKRKKKDFSTNQILDLIGEIKDLGTAILGITGGEPMLRLDLEEIISAASPELTTIIYTTGYNFDKKRAEKLLKADIGCIIIGIESTDADYQDKIRGKKGSLQTAINAINICNEVGIYSAIGTIGTREKMNSGEINRIYNLADSLNVKEMRLIFPSATGSWAGHTDEILRADELELHKEFKIKYSKKQSGPIVTSLAHLESEEMFGCTAGYNFLYIDSTGEICPCDLTPLSFGNIKNKPLKEIWMEMEQYFPQPLPDCLMRNLSFQIKSDTFPLTPKQSKKIIPHYRKNTPLPRVYKKLWK